MKDNIRKALLEKPQSSAATCRAERAPCLWGNTKPRLSRQERRRPAQPTAAAASITDPCACVGSMTPGRARCLSFLYKAWDD